MIGRDLKRFFYTINFMDFKRTKAELKVRKAAPDLLKALEDIINQLENEHCSEFMDEFADKGKEAIDKALN